MSAAVDFSPALPGKVILLVEDNPDDEALTLRALSRNGIRHHVHVAHDGVEALDYLFGRGKHEGRDTRQQPAVTLLDLKLPRLDGLEVLRHVRNDARTRCLPIVILTSSREDQDLVQGYGLGANSYIRKPVDFTQFVDAVRQVGSYWLILNEDPPGTHEQHQLPRVRPGFQPPSRRHAVRGDRADPATVARAARRG